MTCYLPHSTDAWEDNVSDCNPTDDDPMWYSAADDLAAFYTCDHCAFAESFATEAMAREAWWLLLPGSHMCPSCFRQFPGRCPCECNHGGFCGGCGHAGCGGRR